MVSHRHPAPRFYRLNQRHLPAPLAGILWPVAKRTHWILLRWLHSGSIWFLHLDTPHRALAGSHTPTTYANTLNELQQVQVQLRYLPIPSNLATLLRIGATSLLLLVFFVAWITVARHSRSNRQEHRMIPHIQAPGWISMKLESSVLS